MGLLFPNKNTNYIVVAIAILNLTSHVDAEEVTMLRTNGIDCVVFPAELPKEWVRRIHREHGPSFGIARIIGVEAEGFWTPDKNDIPPIEAKLKPTLERWFKAPLEIGPRAKDDSWRKMIQRRIGEILAKYLRYSRQYIGLIIDGKKYLYLNAFPDTDADNIRIFVISATDGGSEYWHALYSMEDGQFYDFDTNGEVAEQK